MILRNAVYRILNWMLVRIAYLKGSMDCQDYGKRVHGGPAPKDWRVREGLPMSGRWPRHKDGALGLFIGAVEQPSIWVKAKKGKGLGAYTPTLEVDAAWGDDSWLHEEEFPNA